MSTADTTVDFDRRMDEALDGLRDRQLTFDVGGDKPDHSTLKVTMDVSIPRELRKGSDVVVTVAAADGEVLATTHGPVLAVSFKDEYRNGYVVGTDRIHTVKL